MSNPTIEFSVRLGCLAERPQMRPSYPAVTQKDRSLPKAPIEEIPIEIRSADGAIYDKRLSGRKAPIEAGVYVIRAKLSPGKWISKRIDCTGSGHHKIYLDVPDVGLVKRTREAWEEKFSLKEEAGFIYRLLIGNPFIKDFSDFETHQRSYWKISEGSLVISSWLSAPMLLQLITTDGKITNTFAIPMAPGLPASLVVVPEKFGRKNFVIQPHNGNATLLLSSISEGRTEEARLISASPRMKAIQLLEGKRTDPIAAVVGALSLYRLGELEDMTSLVQKLNCYETWIPDSAVLEAYLEMNLGDATAAALNLKKMAERGLPLFTESLAIAVKVISWLDEVPVVARELTEIRKRLGEIMAWSDFRSQCTKLNLASY